MRLGHVPFGALGLVSNWDEVNEQVRSYFTYGG